MKTRLFSLWLLLSVAVGLSAYDFKVGGLCYKRNPSNKNMVSVMYDETYQELTSANIPYVVVYNRSVYDVKSIEDGAFHGCTKLTSVTIPNSVTSIGAMAFRGCTGLTSITIPNSVMSIGRSAFSGCTGLTSITIPNSVTSIGDDAFSGCSGLISIVVESGNTHYDSRNNSNAIIDFRNNLLAGCRTTIIPNSVTSIGYSAFSGCSGLTSVTIPNSVTSIGDDAFSGCSGLKSVTIPNSVTSIGYGAFSGCSGLISVTIPNSITSIENSAFSGCSGLTSVTIPNSVMNIGEAAFSNCVGLVSITIGSGVTTIGTDALRGCTSLVSVIWNTERYSGYDSESIPDGRETPFNRWSTSDNTYVFDLRSQITSFTFGDSVQSIPNCICNGMKNLAAVIIGNSVTDIGNFAFYSCTSLTTITIPESVTSIGYCAFEGCTGLKSVNYTGDIKGWLSINMGEHSFSSHNMYINDELLTELIIPEGFTKIYFNFADCVSLTSVTIPNSVTSIGYGAFGGCTGLTSVTIPNSVTSIGAMAFEDCTGLTSVTIPDSVKRIGEYAFKGCTGLTSVIIPNSVTSIGDWAFQDCIGFTSITIPNSITSIESGTFCGCTGLTSVTIPNSVTRIEKYAFSQCENIRTLFVKAKEPPALYSDAFYSDAFYSIDYNIPVVVPCGTIGAYKNAEQWNRFTNYVERAAEYNVMVLSQDSTKGVVKIVQTNTCNNDTTIIVAEANEHYRFNKWSDGNMDNPRKVVVVGDTTYIAEFVLLTNHTIFGTCNSQQGSVTGSGTYQYGTIATLTALPNEGYVFTQWSDGNKDNPRKVTVTTDATYTAEFTSQTYTITATCDSKQGQITGGGTYTVGQEVYLTALPNEGYVFTQWSDGNKDNPRKVTVTADATYTAEFTSQTYTITATCDSKQGQVTGGGTYTVGREVYLTATPNIGYAFTQWSDGNKDNPRKVTVTADAIYTAEFALQIYMITATCDNQQGQVTGGGVYLYGSEVTITAIPNKGYEFVRWSDGSTANPYSFLVEKDMTIEALFEPTTPIENVVAEEHIAPRKVFRDGQVYILRGGKTYTLTGVEVNL